jgi:tetratricopeptide (TPR) repeat protein
MEMDAGRLDRALGLFRKSASLSPHYKTFELIGECLMILGRHSDALEPLAEAVALNPGVRARSLLAEAFLALENSDDARRCANLALERDPTNKRAKAVIAKVSCKEAANQRMVPTD